jgi:hypothetical protein
VTDDDIRSNLLKVRRGVQRIVSKSMYFGETKTTKEEPANVPKNGSRMEFYDYLSGLERKDGALQVRARVFRMLNAPILSAKRFGLEQTQLESADGSKMDGEDIGRALADFEEGLIAAKGELPTSGEVLMARLTACLSKSPGQSSQIGE